MPRFVRCTVLILAPALLPSAAPAASHEADPAVVARIEAKLAEMKCQMDPADIEVSAEGGYELDDVICEGGHQFDIELDAELNETGRRAE